MRPPAVTPRSLRVQLVLFNNQFRFLVQTVQGLIAAAAVARSNGSLSRIELAIGDSSTDPCISEEQERGIIGNALDNGFERAWYTFFGANLGSAGGSNALAEGAETDCLLILNPDTYPSPWMLHRMLSSLRDGVGIVEARQLPIEHPKEYDAHTGDVSWASGACSMFMRHVFEEVGGYDTDHFFLHCDDVDISWRVKLAGYRVVMEPSATTLHHKPINLSGNIEPPYAERYHGALGKLMLATRYGAEDVFENTTSWIRANGDDAQQQAVDDFEARAAEGRIPDLIPDGVTVAQFVGTEYAKHRF
ncbi:MAG: glycosyltransferase family 2 protein [Acidimicrobiia bacterium]|nr:glycosyltransferase family 2 protein [Acidimicrobiia bacterium]MDH5503739.1 glycosyltransferase family 2 protein [Acidimicrobiia bacterium]